MNICSKRKTPKQDLTMVNRLNKRTSFKMSTSIDNRKINLDKKNIKYNLGRCISKKYYHIKRGSTHKTGKVIYIDHKYKVFIDRKNDNIYCIWSWRKKPVGADIFYLFDGFF